MRDESKQQVYVRLIDGTQAFVPVDVTTDDGVAHTIIGNSYLDPEDTTAVWEYFPGDAVRVQPFEHGLLASSLISPQTRERQVRSLIFQIVKSFGTLTVSDDLATAADDLRSEECTLPQKDHPLVQKWLATARPTKDREY